MTDRDRLIELLKPHVSGTACLCESGSCELTSCRDCKARRLTDYLLANGVIPLPCKFQQTVWVLPTIENKLPELTKMQCIGFIMSCDSYCANLITDKNKLYQPSFGDFGKTVFLTKEKAEEKLKEFNNG